MNKIPQISVIIPVYNQQEYLARCLRSIIEQSIDLSFYEIILIDDGSTDNSYKIYKNYNDFINIIKFDKNFGLPHALNVGIKNSKGRYIVRLDSDDYVHHEYLNILSLFLNLNDDIDAVACDYQLVDDSEKIIKSINCLKEPIGCGIMFRQHQLINIGLYNEEQLYHEEKELRIRFEEKYEISRIQLPLYRYRRHNNNMTNNEDMMKQYFDKLDNK